MYTRVLPKVCETIGLRVSLDKSKMNTMCVQKVFSFHNM